MGRSRCEFVEIFDEGAQDFGDAPGVATRRAVGRIAVKHFRHLAHAFISEIGAQCGQPRFHLLSRGLRSPVDLEIRRDEDVP